MTMTYARYLTIAHSNVFMLTRRRWRTISYKKPKIMLSLYKTLGTRHMSNIARVMCVEPSLQEGLGIVREDISQMYKNNK